MRVAFFILLLAAVLAGLPSAGRAESSADADLATQAAEILLLERMARDTDDSQVREAAKRQITRLERAARSRAKEELGRDLFRERRPPVAERAAGGAGLRNVRVFGGREVRSPRTPTDPGRTRDHRERDRSFEGHPEGSGRDRDDDRGRDDDSGDSEGRDEDDERGQGSGDDEEPSHSEQEDESHVEPEEDESHVEPEDDEELDRLEREDDDDR